jgi:hypothetical protein
MDNSHSLGTLVERFGFKIDGNQGAGYADHTHGNGAEVTQDPLSRVSNHHCYRVSSQLLVEFISKIV